MCKLASCFFVSFSITVPKRFTFLCNLKKKKNGKKRNKEKKWITTKLTRPQQSESHVKKNHKNKKYIFNSHSIKYLTSARRVILLLSGQIIWSTWERTFSHVKSGVLRLLWNVIWCKYGTLTWWKKSKSTKPPYMGDASRNLVPFFTILKMWKTHMEEFYFTITCNTPSWVFLTFFEFLLKKEKV